MEANKIRNIKLNIEHLSKVKYWIIGDIFKTVDLVSYQLRLALKIIDVYPVSTCK